MSILVLIFLFYVTLDLHLTLVQSECEDKHAHCSSWAKRGECEVNPSYMLPNCPNSCYQCSCGDNNKECSGWAKSGECKVNPGYMLKHCRESCAECKKVVPCIDSDEISCKAWVKAGECQVNPSYMLIHCRKSCGECISATEISSPIPPTIEATTAKTVENPCADDPTNPAYNCPALVEFIFL